MKTALPWLALFVVVALLFAMALGRVDEAPVTSVATGDHGPALERIEARLERLEARSGRPEIQNPSPSTGAGSERTALDDGAGRLPVDDDLAERLAAVERRLAALEEPRGESEQLNADRAVMAQLTAALERGDYFEAQRLLAEEGLDPNAKDRDGQTPLAAAAVSGSPDLIDLLLDYGADLERKAKRGMTPLLAALDADQEAAALVLLDRGANPGSVDKNGENALMWASYNGLHQVIDRVLGDGAKVDWQNHEGRTALMSAARKGNLATVKKLLEAGADPTLADKGGATAYSLAKSKKNKKVMKLLEPYKNW